MRFASSPSTSRRSLFTRVARIGSAAALALMAVTCHSDSTPPCTANSLAFTTQPASTSAGTVFSVQVTVRDGAGSTQTCFNDNVTIALGANPGNATLNGTATVAASNGVATFGSFNLTKAANGYTLTASVGNTTATSVAFNITAGQATVLAFTTQPPGTVAAGAPTSAVVTARDQYGNTAASYAGSITMTINPGSASLSGTTAVTVSSGIASFNNLIVGKAGTGYTLTAAPTAGAPPAGATSTAFNVNAGATAKLAFVVEPTDITAGSAISPAVQVTAQDAQGNPTPGFTGPVTIAIATNPGAGTLSGTATVNALSGIATFPGLSINRPGIGYTLSATAASLQPGTSSAFNVSIGPPAQLVFSDQPTDAVAGIAIGPVTVTAQDASGNPVTSFTGNVTVAFGTNPASATLNGTSTKAAVAGVATFTDLSIDKVAGGYTLTATGAGVSVSSSPFSVSAGPASVLEFTTQPASVAAGAAISTAVMARDQFGNPATSFNGSITISIGTNPGGGTLSGSTSVAASAGVAAFSGLSINKMGTGYTLVASATAGAPPAAATSAAFNISAGAVAKLAFTVQPANGSAGSAITPAIEVTAQDAEGNSTPTFTGTVTLALGSNPGGATLTGGGAVAAVAGVATFSGVSLNKPGTGYTLIATSGALSPATSGTFNVAVGALAQLVFSQQPSNAVAGVSIAPAVVVTAQDAAGNTVTGFSGNVTVAIGTNPGSGTLSGTPTKAAVAGVVTYNSLSINKSGAGYTLTAAAGGVPQIASNAFNIAPAPAAKLSFSAPGAHQPTTTSAGAAITPAVKVTALDQFDNLDTSFTGNVSVVIGTNPKAGTLTGTTTIAAAAGVATFSTLKIDSAAVGYTLSATASGLTDGASSTFDITAGTATHLVFTQQPTNATAGAAIAPAVKVAALDAQGNVAAGYTANVTVAIGTNAGGGTLSGTATVAATAGVASFPGLSIDKSGTGYTLTAASGALTGIGSAPFNIVAGAATQLTVTTQPVTTAAGSAIAPAVVVAAQDALGNTDLTYAGNVVAAIGANPAGGVLSGTLTRAASAGIATFDDLNINLVGTGYTLSFTSGTLTAATSTAFDIFANTATHLVFSVQPANAVAGVAIAPAIVVQALDGSNNVATGFSGGVTIAIGTNAGGGTLAGTASVSAASGVATFSTLSIDKTGDGYTLTATAGGVTGSTSSGFKITPAAATHLAFFAPPTNDTAGKAITPAVVVQALDAFNNIDTAYAANVDVSIGNNPGGGTLSGTTPKAAVHGVTTFSDLSINKSGAGYTLHATSGTLTDATSAGFNISPAALSLLVFTQQPTAVVAGAAIQPDVVVQAQDAFANVVTSFTGSVGIAIGTNGGGGTLGGTTAVNAIAGLATFSNLTINKAGSGYTLVASTSGAPDATSTGFDVTAGAASVLVFTVQPAASTTAGTAISAPVTVAAQDGLGNTVASFASDITVAITTNTGTAGATLSGTKTLTPTNGQAVFSNLSIDSAGTGYTLTATAAGLTGGTSSTFAITPGTVTKLAFTVSPVTTTAGQAIPTISVNAQDALGNTDPGYTADVVVAITGGSGKTGAHLSGTLTHAAVAGVAGFPSLSIDSAGTGYTLTATSGSLTDAVSASFNIDAGPVTQLLFTQQPSSAQAGSAISPAVMLVAKDAIGNVNTGYTASVTLSLAANPGGASPSNNVVGAVAGVAVFPGLFLDKAGTGYTLQASDESVTSAPSNTFNITPGTASKLAFTVQPATVTVGANISPAVKVAAQDAFGNLVTSFSNNVSMSLPTNPGPATLGGSLTRAAISGVATFSTLDLNVAANGYQLGAATSGLAPATSAAFNVIPSAAVALFFKIQPSRTTAGQPIAAFTVEARDASGQLVSGYGDDVTLSITPNTGVAGASLGGTVTRTASAGTATFNDIVISKAGDDFKLTATAAGVTSALSGFFKIDPAAADHLVYTVEPSNATALSPITPQIEVTAFDAFGNVSTYTGNVTMTINANPGAGTLGGTTTKAAVAGVATFNNLSINNAGVGYSLDATASPGLLTTSTVTSNPFDITASTASHLVFASQPTGVTADQTIPTFTIEARDAANSLLTGFTGDVTVTITAGTGTTGATLSGTTTVAAIGGVATFSGLAIDKKGIGYRLSATASGLAGATSNTLTITAGAPTHVVFIQDPTNAVAGVAVAPAILVDVEDAHENRVTTFVGTVTLAISTNPTGDTLRGTVTRPVVNGIATFDDIGIGLAAQGYRLQATSGGLTADVSQAFTITAGTATRLVFTVAPSNAAANTGINPPIRVTAFDGFDNVATGFTGSGNNVTLAITSGTGTAGATLSPTNPVVVAPLNGVAIFSGVSVNLTGAGYTLTATAAGVTQAVSAPFTIN